MDDAAGTLDHARAVRNASSEGRSARAPAWCLGPAVSSQRYALLRSAPAFGCCRG